MDPPRADATLGLVGRGVGVAIATRRAADLDVIVRMHTDGAVTVLCSTVAVGQGLHTVLPRSPPSSWASTTRA